MVNLELTEKEKKIFEYGKKERKKEIKEQLLKLLEMLELNFKFNEED